MYGFSSGCIRYGLSIIGNGINRKDAKETLRADKPEMATEAQIHPVKGMKIRFTPVCCTLLWLKRSVLRKAIPFALSAKRLCAYAVRF